MGVSIKHMMVHVCACGARLVVGLGRSEDARVGFDDGV
jgi:hypothetical protein